MEKPKNFESLNLESIKQDYFKMLSPYFIEIFSNYFTKVLLMKENNQDGKFIFELKIDEKCANPLQIVHGGALATLIENLSSVSLYYLCKMRYRTLDISINYKNQVPLDKPMQIVVTCQKVGSNTSFVEVEIKDQSENVCTQASLIKSKIGVKMPKTSNKLSNTGYQNITYLKSQDKRQIKHCYQINEPIFSLIGFNAKF